MKHYVLGALLGLALLGAGNPVDAGNARSNRKLVESSMLVKGSIVITPDGAVQSYTLDNKEGLGEPLEKFLGNNITHWRFKPVEVDGKVVTAKAPMSLRLIANQEEGGNMSVRIAGTWFGGQSGKPTSDDLRSSKLTPPKYPKEAVFNNGQGIVYLVLQVGRDGHVMNVDAERVNLLVVGTDKQMAVVREQLAKASISAARHWTFQPPTSGPEINGDYWYARVPVSFELNRRPTPNGNLGVWQSYIPDPSPKFIPWLNKDQRAALASDALPGDGIYPLQQDLQLLSPSSA